MEQSRGSFKVICVDGTERTILGRPTIDRIHAALKVTCLDTVTLTRGIHGLASTVMMVDDTGLIDGKPINPKATALYRSVCRPDRQDGTIHGDVAIVNDEDFA